MADVKAVDIDGEQWNIKDQGARIKIATIEEDISSQDLQDIQVTVKDGYTCKSIDISNHYKVGKIHFASIRIEDLSGNSIGTEGTACVAVINLKVKKFTNFITRDYIAQATARCSLGVDGSLYINESNGINNGRNVIIGEIIFAEP